MTARCPILIGRDRELGALRAGFADAARGNGPCFVVRADAGLGKSRLCRELAEHVRAENGIVAVGRAVPSGGSTPFRPLEEVLFQALRSRSGELAASGLGPWLAILGTIAPALLLDASGPVSAPALASAVASASLPADPSLASTVSRGEAILRVLEAICPANGALLIVEDLHWADPDTMAIVEYLADNARDTHLMWLLTMRGGENRSADELVARLEGRGAAAVLELDRLDAGSVDAVVAATAPDTSNAELARIRRHADGVPLLVEELLGSPGLPKSFLESVRARIELVPPPQLDALVTAALLGPNIEWPLLEAAGPAEPAALASALEFGLEHQLLVNDGAEVRFRHALTRDALIASVLPPRLHRLSVAALTALETVHADLSGDWAGIAAELALHAGARARAGELLGLAGTRALTAGALATATDALERAMTLLGPGRERAVLGARQLEALALAGRVDEALASGTKVLDELHEYGESTLLAQARLHLAQAASAAARWSIALEHVGAARALVNDDDRTVIGRADVLEAEARLGRDEIDKATRLAERVTDDPGSSADARCHAHELLGRVLRVRDLASARQQFQYAIDLAEQRALPVWRLRALHEMATIELLEDASTGRLHEARNLALAQGALSTATIVDLQLSAVHHLRFELDAAAQHAHGALITSERLGLDHPRAMALWFLAENHALRRERDESERFIAEARAAAPGDAEIEGMAWAGARAMTSLLEGDRLAALDALAKGMAILPRQPQAPGYYRAMWPLLLASAGDKRAANALIETRRLGIEVNRINRGLLGVAEAILRARRGDAEAGSLVEAARVDLARYPVWRELALLSAGEAARREGWGTPDDWLAVAAQGFARYGLSALVSRCEQAASVTTGRWSSLGVTSREAEVLALVADGLANKEIAAGLALSVRTVEKHVEALLRKTGCASRAQLVAFVRS